MQRVDIRWLDIDNSIPGNVIARERILIGEKVGYEIGDTFVTIWADKKTFNVAQDRVILVDVRPEPLDEKEELPAVGAQGKGEKEG